MNLRDSRKWSGLLTVVESLTWQSTRLRALSNATSKLATCRGARQCWSRQAITYARTRRDSRWAPDSRLIFSRAEPAPTRTIPIFGRSNWTPAPENPKTSGSAHELVGFSFASPTLTADGKRVAFLKCSFQSTVYTAELKARGTRLTTARPLTLDDRNDWPTAWTSDSRAVIFWSDRNGSNQVFTQNIDQQTAEPVITGPGQAWMPRLSPDGRSILYRVATNILPRQTDEVARIMRMPSSGGTPEFVMEVPRLANYACPRAPSDVCFLGQLSEDGQKIVISAFDPLTGKEHAVRTVGVHPGGLRNWMPSPDGSRLVFMEFNTLEGRIRLLSLRGDPDRDLVVNGWAGFNSVDWAADGKSLFVSVSHPRVQPCCTWTWKVTRRHFGINVGLGEPLRSPRRTGAN